MSPRLQGLEETGIFGWLTYRYEYGAFHLEHAPCSMQQVTLNPMRY